jgi:hypothetical protein
MDEGDEHILSGVQSNLKKLSGRAMQDTRHLTDVRATLNDPQPLQIMVIETVVIILGVQRRREESGSAERICSGPSGTPANFTSRRPWWARTASMTNVWFLLDCRPFSTSPTANLISGSSVVASTTTSPRIPWDLTTLPICNSSCSSITKQCK